MKGGEGNGGCEVGDDGQGEPTEAFSSLISNFSSSKKASLVRKRSQKRPSGGNVEAFYWGCGSVSRCVTAINGIK